MEVEDDINGQEDVTGLNDSTDSTQLIRTKLEVDMDELMSFRRLHVFRQQPEQHGEKCQGQQFLLWVASYVAGIDVWLLIYAQRSAGETVSLFHPTGYDTSLIRPLTTG